MRARVRWFNKCHDRCMSCWGSVLWSLGVGPYTSYSRDLAAFLFR